MKILVTGTSGFIGSHLAIKDLNKFKKISDVIVANRISEDISDNKDKIYTRDIFNSDS